ncbi:hypothetical protein Tco_1324518 [Tanacetum coccineum]
MFFSFSHSHDPRTIEDFYRPSLIGRGGLIASTTDFVLKNRMVRLLRQNFQFHGFRDEDANKHLDSQYLKLGKDLNHVYENVLIIEFRLLIKSLHFIMELRWLIDTILWWLPDAEVYYDTTTGVTTHYSDTTSALSAQIEVLGKQTAYTIQSVQHNPGPGHPNTFYYSDSDESDDDEPSVMIEDQKSIHHLSGSPTPSFKSVVESLSPLPTRFRDRDSLMEETDTLFHSFDNLHATSKRHFALILKRRAIGSTTTILSYSLPRL